MKQKTREKSENPLFLNILIALFLTHIVFIQPKIETPKQNAIFWILFNQHYVKSSEYQLLNQSITIMSTNIQIAIAFSYI